MKTSLFLMALVMASSIAIGAPGLDTEIDVKNRPDCPLRYRPEPIDANELGPSILIIDQTPEQTDASFEIQGTLQRKDGQPKCTEAKHWPAAHQQSMSKNLPRKPRSPAEKSHRFALISIAMLLVCPPISLGFAIAAVTNGDKGVKEGGKDEYKARNGKNIGIAMVVLSGLFTLFLMTYLLAAIIFISLI